MSNYLAHLQSVTGTNSDLARARSIVGDAGGSTISTWLDKAAANAPRDVGDNVGTLVGAAAGGVYGATKGHPVLGVLLGASLGRNVPALLHANDRRIAFVNMGETAVASAVSLASKQHPAAGFIIGRIVAGVIVHLGKLRGE